MESLNSTRTSRPNVTIKDTKKVPAISKNCRNIENKFIYFKDFKIGAGSFGSVLYGTDLSRENEYAIKFEKTTLRHSALKEELKIYNDLKSGIGIPEIYWHGKYKNGRVMVMDLLGPSLDKFFKTCDKRLNLQTTLHFGYQMIERIEYVHSCKYLHRDIKPNNFLLGKFSRHNYDDSTVYIVDFGLSKEYIDETGEHYEYKEDKRFVGTPRYASINTHMGIRQSRRDDLQSIAYVLIYFLKSELPWQGIKAKTKSERKEKIKIKKATTDINELCLNIPKELGMFLKYTCELEFDEKPDYDYIKKLFIAVRDRMGYPMRIERYAWDWNEMFLKAREKGCSFAQYSILKKKYEKLFEGYVIPSFEDYLNKIDPTKEDNYTISDKIEIKIVDTKKFK
jgi:serine/threonine protein kinase